MSYASLNGAVKKESHYIVSLKRVSLNNAIKTRVINSAVKRKTLRLEFPSLNTCKCDILVDCNASCVHIETLSDTDLNVHECRK